MSDARRESWRARATLIVGLVLCGAGLVWLAASQLNAQRVEGPPGSASTEPHEGSPPGSPPVRLSIESSKRVSAGDETRALPAATSLPVPAVPERSAWMACLGEGDEDGVRECLRSTLEPHPDPARIAAFLCSDAEGTARHFILVSEAVARIPAAEALDWLDDVQSRCSRYKETHFLEECLLSLRKTDPAWIAELRRTMTPDRLFDAEKDETGIQILALFAREGDEEAREWIQTGARGEWGGTLQQVDRAIGISISLQQPGEEWLANLRSITQSSRVPEGGAIGSTFVHALIDSRAWPDGSSGPALDTLLSVLYDPRFQDSAAATLCLSFPAEPPPGCDAAMWETLRSRAREIATRIGLSGFGAPR